MIKIVTKFVSLFAICWLFYALLFCFPLLSNATVTGDCSNCHTMHNSQGGQPIAKEYSSTSRGLVQDSTPNPALLINNCIGCHFNSGAATIDNYGTPIVLNRNDPSQPLGGGNFYNITPDDATGHAKGHNVAGINNIDAILGLAPPGGTSLGAQLRCAGTYGCHGHNGRQSGDTPINDERKAIFGGHHGDDTPPLNGDLTSVARNFRFLLGIAGKEDNDWEQETTIDHNEYKGDTNFSATDTVSFLCTECHGDFHSTIGVGSVSPWLRHPTDIFLPQTGEYATYNPPTTYNNLVPVAYTDFNNPSRATAVIMCLSCHRAHASPFFKMMRWDYKGWPVCLPGCTNGCNVCHTSKN